MTVNESTICNLIQSFPVLLILAQNHQKCLKTPFIYKPPSPTPSPEYYAALDALFQNLFGHGYPGNNHGHYDCHGLQKVLSDEHHGSYSTYGIPNPCYGSHGYGTQSYGHHFNTGHDLVYGYPGYGIGQPTYGYKKINVYNLSASGYDKGYAPNQVYNLGHKYKIVVKKNKGRPHRRRSQKIQGFYPNHRDNRYHGEQGFVRNFLPQRMTQTLAGMFHVQNRDPYNGQYVYPFNDRGISNNNQFNPYQQYQNQNYGYDQYGRPVRFPTNEGGTQNIPYEVVVAEYEDLTGQGNTGSINQPQPVEFPTEDKANDNNPVEPVTPSENDDNATPSSTKTILLVPENPFSKPVPNNNGFPVLHPVTADPKGFPTFGPVTEANPGFSPLQPATNSADGFYDNAGDSNGEKPQILIPVAKETQGFPTLYPVTESKDPAYPELTPVPQTEKRNNLNFGSEGIFQETCQTVEGGVGSCLTVFSCQPYLRLLQQSKSNPALVQVLRKAHCGFEGNTPKVCCPRQGIPTAPPPAPTPAPTTTTTTTTTTTAPVTEPEDKSGSYATLLEAPHCGLSNGSLTRVVGGEDAKLGDFPWMALLGYFSNRTRATSWKCGGTLISSRHILTAAHCIYNHETELYVVRLGELDLEKEDDGATPVDVLIKSKVLHENYSPNSFSNDIGLLVLQQDVQFTSLIKPICIPRQPELRARSYENYTPFIAGWGDLKYLGPSSSHLQVLQLPVVSNDFCSKAFAKYESLKIDERVLCAGFKAGGKDACQGDSGGPLMQPVWNTNATFFYQIGVVSFGKKCAEPGFPGVYTRVTHFVPWIEKTISNTA